MKSETKLVRGVVDPDDYSDDELIVMSLRVPEALARSVDQALDQFSTMIGGRESFVLTALAYSLCCVDEQQRRAGSKQKRPTQKK